MVQLRCPQCGGQPTTRPGPHQYRGLKEMPDGTLYRAHQCPRCSIIYMSVERMVDESNAELMEESLYQLPPTESSKPKPFTHVLRDKWSQPSSGSKRQES